MSLKHTGKHAADGFGSTSFTHDIGFDGAGTHCDGDGEGAMPNSDRSSHGSPEKGVPSHSLGCQAMAACALSMMPTVGAVVPTHLMATGDTAIAGRIQVLASMTFSPEPPPPKA